MLRKITVFSLKSYMAFATELRICQKMITKKNEFLKKIAHIHLLHVCLLRTLSAVGQSSLRNGYNWILSESRKPFLTLAKVCAQATVFYKFFSKYFCKTAIALRLGCKLVDWFLLNDKIAFCRRIHLPCVQFLRRVYVKVFPIRFGDERSPFSSNQSGMHRRHIQPRHTKLEACLLPGSLRWGSHWRLPDWKVRKTSGYQVFTTCFSPHVHVSEL